MSRSRHQDANPAAISTDLAAGTTRYIFKPKALEIIWGKDNRFWRIENDVAELIQVYWLEVTGLMKVVSSGRWEVTFAVSFNPDAFGWKGTTVRMMTKVGEHGDYKETKIQVTTEYGRKVQHWCTEIEVTADQPDRTIYFGLYEIWSGKWKGGLKIHHASLHKKA